METEIVTAAATDAARALPDALEPAPAESENKPLRWFELGLVLLVAFGNFFLTSFSYFVGIRIPAGESSSQNMHLTMNLVQEVIALLVLAYVLARRKLRIRDLGLRWSARDVPAGALVAMASYVPYTVGYFVFDRIHQLLFGSAAHQTSLHALFGRASIMMLVYSLLNPFFEELIVRAYLMTEIKTLTGSWTLAAALSTAVQTSYHLYYGWTMALALGCQFLVFSIYYARTRKATPLVLAHGIFDWIGILQLI